MRQQPQGQKYVEHPIAMASQNDDKGWETLTHSPLIQGEGDDKMLNLQFDVSQFEPSEVSDIEFNLKFI